MRLRGGFYTDANAHQSSAFLSVDPSTGKTLGTLLPFPDYDPDYVEYAAFGSLTYRFTERFDIQFGARQSKIEQDMNDNSPTSKTRRHLT